MSSEQQPQSRQRSQGIYLSQDGSPREQSAEPSTNPSRPGSTGPHESRPREKRPRVHFTSGGESMDSLNNRSTFDVRDTSQSPSRFAQPKPRQRVRRGNPFAWSVDTEEESHSPEPLDKTISADISESPARASVSDQRQSETSNQSSNPDFYDVREQFQSEDDNEDEGKVFSQFSAQERAQRLARVLGSQSEPTSRRPSPARSFVQSLSPPSGSRGYHAPSHDIPLVDLNGSGKHNVDDDTDEDDEGPPQRRSGTSSSEAHRLVRAHTRRDSDQLFRVHAPSPGQRSGHVTPEGDRDPDVWVPPPRHYRGGILSSLLKLYDEQGVGAAWGDGAGGPAAHPQHTHHNSSVDAAHQTPTPRATPRGSPGSSGRNTPKVKHQKWYQQSPNLSTSSLSGLISSSTMLAQPGSSRVAPKPRLKHKSNSSIGAAINRIGKPRLEDEIRITVHIAETLSRQKFLLKLCRALMSYGAPTHRLEGEPF